MFLLPILAITHVVMPAVAAVTMPITVVASAVM